MVIRASANQHRLSPTMRLCRSRLPTCGPSELAGQFTEVEHHELGGLVDLASPGGDGGVGVAGPDRVQDAGVVGDDSIDGVLVVEPQKGYEQAELEGEAQEHGFESGHT